MVTFLKDAIMKKVFSFTFNQVLTSSQYLILLFMLFWSCSSTKIISSKYLLIPIDTKICNYDIYGFSSSYYSPEYKTQMNFYCRVQDSISYSTLCRNSITPTSSFPFLSNTFEKLIANDLTSFIYRSGEIFNSNYFIQIDTNGIILKKISKNLFLTNNRDTLIFRGPLSTVPVKKEQNKTFFYSDLMIYKSAEYQFTHQKVVSEICLTEDSILFTGRQFGHFPIAFLNPKNPKLFDYGWDGTTNKKAEMVIVFGFYPDSLFVFHPDKPDKTFPIKSKHQQSNVCDASQRYDYIYRKKTWCESFYYSSIFYDPFRELYYVTTSIPMPFENKDGTFNDYVEDKSWSIIVLDSNFNQVDEIDMPNYLSKHNIMIVSEGIAISNKKMKEKNNGNSVYVIYKIKEK
jgi:hypothetical protein